MRFGSKMFFGRVACLLCTMPFNTLWSQDKPIAQNFRGIYKSLFALDGVRSPLISYPNPDSKITILFLPDRLETLQLRLAQELKNDFSVLLASNRFSRTTKIIHLGGSYSNYLEYYKKTFSPHRRRSVIHHTPFLWDYEEIKNFIWKDKNTVFFLTSYIIRHLLEQDIYKPRIARAVIVSPSYDILSQEIKFFTPDARMIWMGSVIEETKLKAFQEKFGGEYKTYSRAGRGITIFFRNFTALEDLKNWLK